jgi:hypothetical protein
LLASAEEQLAYERDVPSVDITVELQCMWFDDFYDAKNAESDAAFNPLERDALARFHDAYSERVDRLPLSNGTVRTWLQNPLWQEVMREAQHAIDQITPC